MLKKVISIAIILVMMIMLTACDSKLLSRIDELEATIREQSDRIEQLEKEVDKEILRGNFYSIETAIGRHWLTRDDIMHICYFKSGRVMEGTVDDSFNWKFIDFEPQIDTPQLSQEDEANIKNTYYKLNRDLFQDKEGNEKYSVEDVWVEFYGRYNDTYVVKVGCNFISSGDVLKPMGFDGIVWNDSYPLTEVFRYFNIK